MSEKYDEAFDVYKEILSTNPKFALAHYYLGAIYASRSMFNEAVSEIQEARMSSPGSLFLNDILAYSYALSGRGEEAMSVVADLLEISKKEYVSPLTIAGAYIGLDGGLALEWFEKAYLDRAPSLVRVKELPIFDSLRSNPKYLSIMAKMGL